ncbi:MAG: SDR family oxidoreductase [Desulfovibrionaceae bacterium]|nr:SDR family oxidoreductase [Desulfovibrionaceae bacterium]
MQDVIVLIGTGFIGQAIARRVGAGKKLVLADRVKDNAIAAANLFQDAGFSVDWTTVDIAERASIAQLVNFACGLGSIKGVINAAGVSPSQASVEQILKVDLYGTAVVIEEFGKVIAEGGSGLIISSQSGHRLPALSPEENAKLATAPTEELLHLPFLQGLTNTLLAYQYSKRGNVLRVAGQCSMWSERGARLNAISPGIIITPLARDELKGPRGEGYRKMLAQCPCKRAGTPDEVGDLAAYLMSDKAQFITGSDFLIDGGATASYFYGNLRYLQQGNNSL